MSGQPSYQERELLLQIAGGDEQAFARFVTPLFDRLYGFSLAVTKSAELAEEVVQDAFVRIWQHRQELPAINNIQAWIFTLTKNLAYNSIRRQVKDPILARQLDDYFILSPSSAEDSLLFKDALAVVHQAAASLPPQQRQVFTMNRLQGLSLDEIAAQLNLSKETVKKHLTHALKTVRIFVQANGSDMLVVIIFSKNFYLHYHSVYFLGSLYHC